MKGGGKKEKVETNTGSKKTFAAGESLLQQFACVSVRKVIYTPKNGIVLARKPVEEF